MKRELLATAALLALACPAAAQVPEPAPTPVEASPAMEDESRDASAMDRADAAIRGARGIAGDGA